MPNIVINEVDATLPGTTEYSNFSVVIPGYYDPTVCKTPSNVFNGDNIYECDSAKDFKENIGLIEAKTTVSAVAPTLTTFEAEDAPNIYATKLTPYDFYKTYADVVYTGIVPEKQPTSVGHLVAYIQTTEKGTSEYYKFTKVNTEEQGTYDDKAYYYIITDEGRDAETNVAQYGNQIAYQLLNLGYSVLYMDLLTYDTKYTTDITSFLSPLEDRANYDFRYLISGYIGENENTITRLKNFNDGMAKIANDRGDCLALLEVPNLEYTKEVYTQSKAVTQIGTYVTNNSNDSINKYTAWFAPTVNYTTGTLYGAANPYSNISLPAGAYYLFCAAKAFSTFNEWYAVAGYTRGVCPFTVASTAINLGETAINALEPRSTTAVTVTNRAINIVANFRNQYYMWGNRTAETIGTELIASDFLNIRQLCNTLKKQIYVTCRSLTFDPNSDILWSNFCSKIRPVLETMKADQGIEDFRFIKDVNTQKGKLTARIEIVPIEAVEDFEITVYLGDELSDITIEG